MESGLRRVVGSDRLNPLPHAGTISVFLLAVVVASGVYITLFFGFGDEAAHASIERMTEHPIQSVVRTLHRYSSAALVVTTAVHAWKITVAGRFRGPRRWAWLTGVTALSFIVLTGVTGYWLARDSRAQAIDEAILNVLGGVGAVSALYIRGLIGPSAGTGWGVVFSVWLVHLVLTAVIAWFLVRHLRRSRLPWLPPRHWAIAMAATLVVVAIIIPADLLAPADLSRAAVHLPIDPFVLFLLPPLLSGSAWPVAIVLTALLAVIALAPFTDRRPSPVAVVDPDRCTGCDLCRIDCPYRAIQLTSTVEGSDRSIAVVDATVCVGCGICVGSCAFGAMALPGITEPAPVEIADRHIVLTCEGHLARGSSTHGVDSNGVDVSIVALRCTGMIQPATVGHLLGSGAREVQVVGCAPGDCSYGLGNSLTDERLRGERAPHLARRWAGIVTRDWTAPGTLPAAIADPGRHAEVDTRHWISSRRSLAAVAVVVTSVLAVVLATQAPFGGTDAAGVSIVVDHRPGATLIDVDNDAVASAGPVAVVTSLDGAVIDRATPPVVGGSAVGVITVAFPSGERHLSVALVDGDSEIELFDEMVNLGPGDRTAVVAVDVPASPVVDRGRELFTSRETGCSICHSLDSGETGVGPSLAGVGLVAASRVESMSAEEYLRSSILEPDEYIVDGFRSGQMLDVYDSRLSDDEIDALVAFLIDLEGAP